MTVLNLLFYSILAFSNENPIILDIGQTKDLVSSPSSPIRVQKKGIVSVKDRHIKITLVGKKLGRTSILIGAKKYEVIVVKKKSYQSWQALNQWLVDKRGPSLKVNEAGTFIEGRILRLDDFINLGLWTSENSEFSMRTIPLDRIKSSINDFISSLLLSENLEPSPIIFLPQWHISIGSNKDLMSRYKKLLNPFGIKVIVDEMSLSHNQVLRFQLQIAHVKKSFFRNWGFRWPSEFSASTVPSFQLNNINLALSSLETNGIGKVLSSTSLVIESGKMGEFHNGGEFPVRTNTQFANNVHWKPYGLFIKIKPKANALRQIQLQIETELSAIDQSQAIEGIPGMTRSKLKTNINLDKPQPIILTGLIGLEEGQSRQGLAWLSQIPLLEPLFSTGEFYDNEYELVFILTPSFV
ncbi:MAG: hypothetical protein HRT44_08890 [Bdellovibrionales bacterium]|nr:type II and III secretion system protein [Bdellovibrionales bacterium]NQZ19356.1 hypothetical protein [Bdellovibrionales bacterium]